MENKIKDKINSFLTGDKKRVKIIVAIGLIGMVLVLASEMLPDKSTQSSTEEACVLNYNDYTQDLETRLTEIISSIEGVGECRVMITLESTTESVYATNNEVRNDANSANKKDEYVFFDSDKGETPVLITEYMPKVQGVTVVCSGGDDIIIKEKIIKSVTSLFNISANRVSVSKIKM